MENNKAIMLSLNIKYCMKYITSMTTSISSEAFEKNPESLRMKDNTVNKKVETDKLSHWTDVLWS